MTIVIIYGQKICYDALIQKLLSDYISLCLLWDVSMLIGCTKVSLITACMVCYQTLTQKRLS